MATNTTLLRSDANMSWAIYHELRQRILTGELPAADWISVEGLAAEFGVSRQPVMEAMRRLAGDWLVEIVPQVGCRVASYTPQALADFLNTIGEMESHIAVMASQRRTPEQLERLAELTGRLTDAGALDRDNIELGRQYHEIVLEMADSPLLARLCQQLWVLGMFAYSTSTPSTPDASVLRRRNVVLRNLTKALRAGDGARARELMATWLTRLVEPGAPR